MASFTLSGTAPPRRRESVAAFFYRGLTSTLWAVHLSGTTFFVCDLKVLHVIVIPASNCLCSETTKRSDQSHPTGSTEQTKPILRSSITFLLRIEIPDFLQKADTHAF